VSCISRIGCTPNRRPGRRDSSKKGWPLIFFATFSLRDLHFKDRLHAKPQAGQTRQK
jgi:hypothetical protein